MMQHANGENGEEPIVSVPGSKRLSRLAVVSFLFPFLIAASWSWVFRVNSGLFLFALLSLLMSIIAVTRVGNRPGEFYGKGLASAAVVISAIFLSIVVFILVLVVPTGESSQKKHDDNCANWGATALRSFEIAQRMFYEDQGRYAVKFEDLLNYDKNHGVWLFKDMPNVTFTFHCASQSGYVVSALDANCSVQSYLIKNICWTDSPLHVAAARGERKKVEALLGSAPDLEARGNHGRTPLHYAAHNGYIDIAKLLLDHHADVNALNLYQRTPLHLAIWNGQSEMATFLVSRGANLKIKDDHGRTPYDFAVLKGDSALAQSLVRTERPWETFSRKFLKECWTDAGSCKERAQRCLKSGPL